MLTMTRNHTLRTIGVLFAGAGAGTIAALLYAPQSGRRTRKDLRKYFHRKADQFEDLQQNMRTRVRTGVRELDGSISECIMQTRRAIDDTRSSVAETFNGFMKRFDDGAARFTASISKGGR